MLCNCDWQLTDDDVIGVDSAISSPASIKRVQSMPVSKQAQLSQWVLVFQRLYWLLSSTFYLFYFSSVDSASCYGNGSDWARRRHCTDGSIMFARWRPSWAWGRGLAATAETETLSPAVTQPTDRSDWLVESAHKQIGMSVLCEYVIAAYFAYCSMFCIFQQSAHMHIFPHKLAFLDCNFNIICVSVTYYY